MTEITDLIHAHIITDEFGDSSCSNCNTKYIDINFNWCPWCGARFDEEPEET